MLLNILVGISEVLKKKKKKRKRTEREGRAAENVA